MGLIYEFKQDNVKYQRLCTPLQFPAHFHYHIEMVLMLKGSVHCFTDANKYLVREGDLFISFPNQIHYYESFEDEEYVIFYINPEAVPQFKSLFETNVPRSAHIPAENITQSMKMHLEGIIEGCEAIRRGEKYAEEIRSGYLLTFFGELLRSMELYGPDTGELSALKNIVDFCSRNYTKEISLDTLSAELHISKYYISHIFGSRLNVRFNDYVNSLRISKACLLLADSDLSVTEIGDKVGFATIRTFNRAFLKQIGQSPSEYRRRIEQSQKLSATGGPVVNFVMDKEKGYRMEVRKK